MLVWKMLDACESGSTGGDACRMSDGTIYYYYYLNAALIPSHPPGHHRRRVRWLPRHAARSGVDIARLCTALTSRRLRHFFGMCGFPRHFGPALAVISSAVHDVITGIGTREYKRIFNIPLIGTNKAVQFEHG